MESTGFLTDGFVIITGEIGTGKTILINDFLSNAGPDVITVEIHQTQITAVQFLQTFLARLGFEPFNKKKAELLDMANSSLLRSFEAGRRTVLVIDEAQHLSLSVLEEIRLLAGIETGDKRILSVILAGQPAFKEKLSSPQLEQLVQRTPLHFHLQSLDRTETKSYINHRLYVAGDTTGKAFLPETFDLIYQHTRGVPRRINTLCNTAILCAFADDLTVISANTVNVALAELQWIPENATAQEQSPVVPDRADPDALINKSQPPGPEGWIEFKRVADEQDKIIERLRTELDEKIANIESLREEIRQLREVVSQAPPRNDTRKSEIPADSQPAQIDTATIHAEADHDSPELAFLVPINGSAAKGHPLRTGRLSLGSSSDNDIQIKSNFISAHHAQIISSLTGFILRDLNSTNGTYVNSKRIKRYALRNGDSITIGSHRFKFIEKHMSTADHDSDVESVRIKH